MDNCYECPTCGQENGAGGCGCNSSTANKKQIGGSHYKSAYQHWDMVCDHNVPYLEASCTKYVSRHKKKNGLQDIEKAIHFLEKIQERYRTHNRVLPGQRVPDEDVARFCDSNDVTGNSRRVCELVLTWDRPYHLLLAMEYLTAIRDALAKEHN